MKDPPRTLFCRAPRPLRAVLVRQERPVVAAVAGPRSHGSIQRWRAIRRHRGSSTATFVGGGRRGARCRDRPRRSDWAGTQEVVAAVGVIGAIAVEVSRSASLPRAARHAMSAAACARKDGAVARHVPGVAPRFGGGSRLRGTPVSLGAPRHPVQIFVDEYPRRWRGRIAVRRLCVRHRRRARLLHSSAQCGSRQRGARDVGVPDEVAGKSCRCTANSDSSASRAARRDEHEVQSPDCAAPRPERAPRRPFSLRPRHRAAREAIDRARLPGSHERGAGRDRPFFGSEDAALHFRAVVCALGAGRWSSGELPSSWRAAGLGVVHDRAAHPTPLTVGRAATRPSPGLTPSRSSHLSTCRRATRPAARHPERRRGREERARARRRAPRRLHHLARRARRRLLHGPRPRVAAPDRAARHGGRWAGRRPPFPHKGAVTRALRGERDVPARLRRRRRRPRRGVADGEPGRRPALLLTSALFVAAAAPSRRRSSLR